MLDIIAKGFRLIASYLEKPGRKYSTHAESVKRTSAKHDMLMHPDEPHYATQYLYWIKHLITDLFPGKTATVLDLGCGQGRLSIPVSEFCKEVIGVDFTPKSIEMAKYYSSQHDCSNIVFVLSDVLNYVKESSGSSFDVVLLIEVTIFLPSYKQVLTEILRILKPNGVAFISFRSQYFNILHSIRNKKWASAKMAIAQREGYLWEGNSWFSWHTKEDITSLLTGIGYNQISCVGIGSCSGIRGDPLEVIARPSLLNKWEQKELLDIEIKLAKSYPETGRYILAIARK